MVTFPLFDGLGPAYPYGGIHQQLDDYWKSLGVPNLDLLSL